MNDASSVAVIVKLPLVDLISLIASVLDIF
jgi:hypothetical protein